MLKRFGVSMEDKLLKRFDRLLRGQGYSNRSEAIRDLIRESLVKRGWVKGEKVAGAITMVYDHRKRELVDNLLDIQHSCYNLIISTQHIHLDRDNCLEIIAVKGKSKDIEKLYRSLKSQKGVKHTSFSLTTTGKGL